MHLVYIQDIGGSICKQFLVVSIGPIIKFKYICVLNAYMLENFTRVKRTLFLFYDKQITMPP